MTHDEIIARAFQFWLAAGCKTYALTADEVKAKIPVYVELLGYLDATTLERACKACCYLKDFPSVADVRSAAEVLREDTRAIPEAKDYGDCEFCGGCGQESFEKTVNGKTFSYSQKCRCRYLGYVLPEPKPRKLVDVTKLLAEAAESCEMPGRAG